VTAEKIASTRLDFSGIKNYRENKEKLKGAEVREDPDHEKESVQTEMGLNEPPESGNDKAKSEQTKKPAPTNAELNAIWNEFASKQGPRIASLMKLLSGRLEGNVMVVTAGSQAQLDSLDEIKISFNRYLIEKTGDSNLVFKPEKGEVKESERRPYTDREKLDFLLKKHPDWQEMIEKLHLRLP